MDRLGEMCLRGWGRRSTEASMSSSFRMQYDICSESGAELAEAPKQPIGSLGSAKERLRMVKTYRWPLCKESSECSGVSRTYCEFG